MSTRRDGLLFGFLGEKVEGFVRALRSGTSRKILLWSFFIALSGYFLWSALSGNRGLFSYVEIKKTLESLEGENLERLRKNQSLEKEIYLLRHSPTCVEEIAREEYGYIRKGEKIFWFPEGKEPSDRKTYQGPEAP